MDSNNILFISLLCHILVLKYYFMMTITNMSYGKWNSLVIWDFKKVIFPVQGHSGNEKIYRENAEKKAERVEMLRYFMAKCRSNQPVQISYYTDVPMQLFNLYQYWEKSLYGLYVEMYLLSIFNIWYFLKFLLFIVILILSQPFFNVWKQSFLQILYSPYYVALRYNLDYEQFNNETIIS